MENKEEIEIDEAGVEMQRREEILKSEHFVDIRIVIGEDFENPVTQVNMKGNPLMVASAIACLRKIEQEILKITNPMVEMIADSMTKSVTSKTIPVDREEE